MILLACLFSQPAQRAGTVAVNAEMSKSIPFLPRPEKLDGSMAGDMGFDMSHFRGFADALNCWAKYGGPEAFLAKLPELDTGIAKEPIEIGVHYGGRDGPDLEWICADLNVTRADLIATHTDAIHTVEMIGFTPGFAYLSGLPDTFVVSLAAKTVQP